MAAYSEPEYSEKSGLLIIVPGKDPIVDIIAVHGLAANPVYTWIRQIPATRDNAHLGRENEKGKREVVWLKHLLPQDIPEARILKFNYDSTYLVNAPKEDLSTIGKRLAEGIHELRTRERNTKNRPIVFLGHSFGGIVIEEALRYSYRPKTDLEYIPSNTCGVLFLGTPHRGSNASFWGEAIANSASRFGFGSNSELLNTLKVGSKQLKALLSDFVSMARELEIELVCFYELRDTQLGKPFGVKTKVVEEESARIDGYPAFGLSLDHSDLNKFGSPEEEAYKLISQKLREATDRSQEIDRKLKIDQQKTLFPGRAFLPSSTTLPAVEEHCPCHLEERHPYHPKIASDALSLTQSPATLDLGLSELKDDYFCLLESMEEFRFGLYLPTEGMTSPGDKHTFDLFDAVQKFLQEETPQKVCLIQGAAGSGKSTFSHYLARFLWKQYETSSSSPSNSGTAISNSETARIPLFISLAALHDPRQSQQDLIATYFKDRGFSDQQIQLARRTRRFIFILDGYDEISRRDRNFYQENRLEKWKAKAIISSRPEYLPSGYRGIFCPPNQLYLLEEYWIAPFSTAKIEEYIQKYNEANSLTIPNDFKERVFQSDMRALISNPFILRMVMSLAPVLTTIQGQLTRVVLYNHFINHWFNQSQERLNRIQLSESQRALVWRLYEGGFMNHGRTYCQDFALELYRLGILTATYNTMENGAPLFERFLTNENEEIRILRLSSPLIQEQKACRFLHKSLRDYLVASAILDDQLLAACSDKSLINQFHIVNDSGIMDFIVEEFRNRDLLYKQLLAYVEKSKSKHGASVSQAAANSITILVKSGISFTGYDLRKAKIPHADLSFGWFDNTQFQGADLSNVRFTGAWLREAQLSMSSMDSVTFGELPFMLPNMDQLKVVRFSPDSQFLAIAGNADPYRASLKEAQIWTLRNWQRVHSFHVLMMIKSMKFSPNSNLLAVGTYDIISLFSLSKLELVHEFTHTEHIQRRVISAVNFSPDSELLASGCVDGTVRIWSIASKECLRIFHSSTKYSVLNFSPDNQFFCVSNDSTSIELRSILSQESTIYFQAGELSGFSLESAAFSFDNMLLACGYNSGNLLLLSVPSLQHFIFQHNTNSLDSVAFSPNSQLIACGWNDGVVGLLSVTDQRLIHRFAGGLRHPKSLLFSCHNLSSSIDFSADGNMLASVAGLGEKVHLLSISSNQQLTSNDSVEFNSIFGILALDISPNGQFIAYRSDAQPVTVWDAQNRQLLSTFEGTKPVTFSPDSQLIVTSFHSEVILCPLQKKELSYRLEGKREVRSLSFHPDGMLLASLHTANINEQFGGVSVWSIPGKQLIHSFPVEVAYHELYSSIDFSSDGQLLVLTTRQNIQLWSAINYQLVFKYTPDMGLGKMYSTVFHPKTEMIAFTYREDPAIRIWSASKRELIGKIERSSNKSQKKLFYPEDNPLELAFSPDCNLLAVWGSEDLELYSVDTKKLLAEIQCNEWARTLGWVGNHQLCTGGYDGILRLWQIKQSKTSREKFEISCVWASSQVTLCLNNAIINGVGGLSAINERLLKQRGAIGYPTSGVVASSKRWIQKHLLPNPESSKS